MRGLLGIPAAAIAAGVVLGSAAAANAAGSNAVAYRAQVNAICRSYTPKFKSVESDLAAAKKAGNEHRYGYDLGLMLAFAYKEGMRVEHAPVPADAKKQMAGTLQLLHSVDLEVHSMLAAAVAGDAQGFASESVKLGGLAGPLNRRFDAVGLRDCGSNQQ